VEQSDYANSLGVNLLEEHVVTEAGGGVWTHLVARD
jgi:hypothetical protein